MVDKRVFAGLGLVFGLLFVLAIILVFGGSDVKKTDLTLYYINPTDYVLEKKIVTVDGNADLEILLTNLFKGTDDQSLDNLFPVDVKYNSSKVDKENNILIVDLSKNVLAVNYGLEVNYLYIMSIVNTIGDFTDYDSIKFTFDGKVVEFFNNGLYLGDALKRDYSVVK
ncbi:MAG: GerMN domain-containing protein [Firmicutes bacterium]|nr:GerMN domain-containing protein [Bacillota bacterium]